MRVCCGIDVHKKRIFAAIAFLMPDSSIRYEERDFATFNDELQQMCDWLLSHGCKDALMESTGKYWIPVFNILEKNSIRASLTHPKYVRAIKGKKTDKKDARHIAELHMHYKVRASFVPPPDIRYLRTMSRYRHKLTCDRSSEKKRLQDCLTVSNIALASVLADACGKSGMEIQELLLENPLASDEEIKAHIYGRAKKRTNEILRSVHGFVMPEEQRVKIRLVREHIAHITAAIADIECVMAEKLTPYAPQLTVLQTVPGVSRKAAMQIIAEIGADMTVFESAKHLVNWAGLAPCNDESAGKKKSQRTMGGGAYLKPLMIQCARAAVRCKTQPYYANKYWRIKARRGDKRAIVAIARMMLTAIYHLLSTGETFNPVDKNAVESKKKAAPPITDDVCLDYLAKRGIDVTSIREQLEAKAHTEETG